VGTQLPFGSPITNEGSLKDDAFRPKLFTIRIEQGNFVLPAAIGKRPTKLGPAHCLNRWRDPRSSRSAMRLLFDPSPYPPANEWKEFGFTFGCPKEFTGGTVKKLEGKGRAMNDVPDDGCIVS
jgi:hypothetical protein